MPLYGYACKSCGHMFQTLVRSSDVPTCPACAGGDLEQQLSLIASPAKGGSDPEPVCAGGGGGCGQCCGMGAGMGLGGCG
ncbi:zinc ribbon domain-containing protein [Rhodoplanes serenus]|jgi:putative FmdB family regulatory protein|uniref:Zinc ribbon domain-containing protein n=1 Tax=Rhodoplanes serenus TaxID=200615 RepID=A0A327KFN9_9BRAD|nr:zinc ribbon domain-containing protein [Rhodoplanes serenus]MTW19278.1 zinc ribbon domain-containing protein [Rhodoplanes serenus]RAI36941.1 FmdB family transcriptional regulator [Rhodoplanes serenus]